VESLSRTPDAGIAVWPPEIIDSARGSKLVIRLTVSIPDECYERLRRLFSSKPAALPITRSAYAILELRILMTRRTAVAAAIEIDGEFDGDQCIISVSTMVNQKGRPTVARNAIENKESELISVGR
jgi:hypothetical protein